MQCTMTSSPGFQRVTPGPTFQTTPGGVRARRCGGRTPGGRRSATPRPARRGRPRRCCSSRPRPSRARSPRRRRAPAPRSPRAGRRRAALPGAPRGSPTRTWSRGAFPAPRRARWAWSGRSGPSVLSVVVIGAPPSEPAVSALRPDRTGGRAPVRRTRSCAAYAPSGSAASAVRAGSGRSARFGATSQNARMAPVDGHAGGQPHAARERVDERFLRCRAHLRGQRRVEAVEMAAAARAQVVHQVLALRGRDRQPRRGCPPAGRGPGAGRGPRWRRRRRCRPPCGSSRGSPRPRPPFQGSPRSSRRWTSGDIVSAIPTPMITNEGSRSS